MTINKNNFDILQNIATLAGEQISMKEEKIARYAEEKIASSKITKIENDHKEEQDLYCVAVPGKAFFIRSNDKVSVTGNTLHCQSIIRLFKTFCKENRGLLNDELKGRIYDMAEETVKHEDAFIDLAFEMGGIEGMTAEDLKKYIRFIADRRLLQLGLKTKFKVRKNPLPWLEEIMNSNVLTNFFEGRSTEYTKAMTTGTWEDAFEYFGNIED